LPGYWQGSQSNHSRTLRPAKALLRADRGRAWFHNQKTADLGLQPADAYDHRPVRRNAESFASSLIEHAQPLKTARRRPTKGFIIRTVIESTDYY
jgi:hypothetical protein